MVQWEGLAWAYRARGGDRFERVRVLTDHPATDGWVVDGPLAAGDSVRAGASVGGTVSPNPG